MTSHERAGLKPPHTGRFRAPSFEERMVRWLPPGVELPNGRLEPPGNEAPLSFAQEELWYQALLDPSDPRWNEYDAILIRGPLDPEALAAAVGSLADRHDAFRIAFASSGGEPVIRYLSDPSLPFALVDESAEPDPERHEFLQRCVRAVIDEPFDLAAGRLARATLFRLSPQTHFFVLALHHIIKDLRTEGVLMRDIERFYAFHHAGEDPGLPALTVSLGAWSRWQRVCAARGAFDDQIAYWTREFEGLSPAELPGDFPRPAVVSGFGAKRYQLIDGATIERLRSLAHQEDASLYTVLIATFALLLHRYTGKPDVPVVFPIDGRMERMLPLVGYLTNNLVFRARFDANLSFRELIRCSRDVLLAGYWNQDAPMTPAVRRLAPTRRGDQSGLVSAGVTHTARHRRITKGKPEFDGCETARIDIDAGSTKLDVFIEFEERVFGLRMKLEYRSSLYRDATMERFLANFERLLVSAADRPDASYRRLNLLCDAERVMLAGFGTGPPAPASGTVCDAIRVQVRDRGDNLAIVEGECRCTYRQLDEAAERLARDLVATTPRSPIVGLCAEPSIEMAIGMLAILRAGGAYLPLDPAYPPARLRFMLEDSQAETVLATRATAALVRSLHDGCIVGIEDERTDVRAALPGVREEALAYAMYTSGSTGTPNGVLLEHRSLANYLEVFRRVCGLRPSDAILQLASISFDISVEEIWGALSSGTTLVIPRRGIAHSVRALLEECRRRDVTVLDLPTAYFNELVVALELGGIAWPRSLRLVVVGGESLRPDRVSAFRRHVDRSVRLVNGYGPTETTVAVTLFEVDAQTHTDESGVRIGRPIDNVRFLVLDEWGQEVPIGVIGQLYVGGAALARGYLARPQLTAERFRPDARGGGRWFATGDLVRYQHDGTLEFHGRRDEQVKIRGFRVEPAELEATLVRDPRIGDAAVVIDDEGRLFAFVVARSPELNARDVQQLLAAEVPSYALPRGIALLDAIPLTENGKRDRRALLQRAADAERDAPSAFSSGGGPTLIGDTEQRLASIWKGLLGDRPIDRDDDFFAMGGHSLLAARMFAQVEAQFGRRRLALQGFLARPTIAALARTLQRQPVEASASALAPILHTEVDAGGAPLSFSQLRLWLLNHFDEGIPTYNVPYATRLRGRLDVAALRRALDEIVRRHEALRTSFRSVEGEPRQFPMPPRPVPFGTLDLRGLARDERVPRAQALFGEIAHRRFDLAAGELVRATLALLDEDDHALLVLFCHIAFDGWSIDVFRSELTALYDAFSSGAPSPLPEPALQYADFACWQRGGALETEGGQLRYWQGQLAGTAPLLELPTDRPRPPLPSYAGAVHAIVLDEALVSKLHGLSRERQATLFMTLLAGFDLLLHRYAGVDDIVVGTQIANRTRPELESLIGVFVNTLVLRTDMGDDPTVVELLERVKRITLEAVENADVPFERVVEVLRPQRIASLNPFVQVLFVLQNASMGRWQSRGLAVEPLHVDAGTARVDLAVQGFETEGSIRLLFEYSTELFERATIERMAAHLETVLRWIVEDPFARLSRIELPSEAERRELLARSQTQPASSAARNVHEPFAARVAAAPNAIAVSHEGRSLTYAELDERAGRVAQALLERGVRPREAVGLCMERSLDMVVGTLAIVKAGALYVPLDPTYPAERLRFMLADANIHAVLAHQPTLKTLPPFDGAAIRIEAARSRTKLEGAVDAAPADPIYAIYTSGSTGTPKAAVIPHRAVLNLTQATNYVDVRAGDTIAQVANSSFDAATFEIWGALLGGARLAICPQPVVLVPQDFARFLAREHVDILFLTTALFNEIARVRPAAFAALRTLLVGGEVLDPASIDAVLAAAPPQRLCNVYGPTETTTFATFYEIAESSDRGGSIPIGRPIAGARAHVMDSAGKLAPVGVPGELWIGGAGVALGYHGRPELTDRRFVIDPFANEPGTRMYRTGDRVRWRADGLLEFIGRLDEQVKVRGYRIEPGEIEAELRRAPHVEDAAVILRDEPNGKQLAAFIVARDGEQFDPATLRARLLQRLPRQMIPTRWSVVPELPLTPNGKVDRRALAAAPAAGPASLVDAFDIERVETVHYQIREIWETLLGTSPVGFDDNFFDLGGHSLLAARMIDAVERACGQRISLASLMLEPTIATVARLVLDGAARAAAGLLVELQPNGDRTPLFFLHGDPNGGGFYCRKLAQGLGERQPFFVLSPHGAGGRPMPRSVEAMSAEYVALIRSVQPAGPYRIGGFCSGGLVAFEVALQLQAGGEQVERLVLINAEPAMLRVQALTGCVELVLRPLGVAQYARRRITVSLAVRLLRLGAIWRRGLSAAARYLFRDLPAEAGRFVRGVRREGLREMERTLGDPQIALLSLTYRPRRFRGKLDLIWSSEERAPDDTPGRAWEPFVDALELRVVPGDHHTSITHYADEAIAALQACLEPRAGEPTGRSNVL